MGLSGAEKYLAYLYSFVLIYLYVRRTKKE